MNDFHFHKDHKLPVGKRLRFNGQDWTERCAECDVSEGWVKAYDALPDTDETGEFCRPVKWILGGDFTIPTRESSNTEDKGWAFNDGIPRLRKYFGKVEIR